MYLTSGANVRTRRSRSVRSQVRRYSFQSSSVSSEDSRRCGAIVASFMLEGLLQVQRGDEGDIGAARGVLDQISLAICLVVPSPEKGSHGSRGRFGHPSSGPVKPVTLMTMEGSHDP